MAKNPHSAPNSVRLAEENVYMFNQRRAGLSIQEIANAASQRFGKPVSKTTVARRLKGLVAELEEPARVEARAMELERLDYMLARLHSKIAAGDVRAVEAALRIGERRAKLLGLDAVVKVDATVTQTSPVDAAVAELTRQLEAAAAAEEERLRAAP